MKITIEALLNLFKKPFTEKYPYIKKEPHTLFRGKIQYDSKKCIGCRLCEKNCPVKAIKFVEKGKIAFDLTKCIYCGFCEDVCPVKAISFTTEFELASKNKEELKLK